MKRSAREAPSPHQVLRQKAILNQIASTQHLMGERVGVRGTAQRTNNLKQLITTSMRPLNPVSSGQTERLSDSSGTRNKKPPQVNTWPAEV